MWQQHICRVLNDQTKILQSKSWHPPSDKEVGLLQDTFKVAVMEIVYFKSVLNCELNVMFPDI